MKFSPYNKPTAPSKPRETIEQKPIVLKDEIVTAYSDVEVPDGATHVYVEPTVCEEEIDLCWMTRTGEVVPNPDYEKQMKVYKKKYAKYREDLKWWKERKKEYDAERKAKLEAREKQQLKKLKEKYE